MVLNNTLLEEKISIGLIQTDLNRYVAWEEAAQGNFKMHDLEAKRSWLQIKSALNLFASSKTFPDIVLLPELAIPRHTINALNQHISKNGGILIGGIDYTTDHVNKFVKNEAIITVSAKLKGALGLKNTVSKTIGKTHAAPAELEVIAKTNFEFKGDNTVWLFESQRLGRFGVTICYDLMDLERALMYRAKIHHLFVIAYNQDIDSFYHLAEAVCRTIYCNVVICNTGFYGGSLAIKPFRSTWKRTVYRHEGAGMETSQIIELPLIAIDNAQKFNISKEMKSLPPGFHTNEVLKDFHQEN